MPLSPPATWPSGNLGPTLPLPTIRLSSWMTRLPIKSSAFIGLHRYLSRPRAPGLTCAAAPRLNGPAFTGPGPNLCPMRESLKPALRDGGFARRLGAAVIFSSACLQNPYASAAGLAGTEVKMVDLPPVSSTNPFYTNSRAPLAPSPLIKLPIGSITPKGWLRHQLELEAKGLTGHLQEISKWCKFEGNAWANTNGQGHSGWGELPYWLKGYGDRGYVLKDEAIIQSARRWIDGVLASQEPDGWFGPRSLRTSLEGKPDLWPHMVMCNVLQSFYEFTGDARVLPLLTRYFRWLNMQQSRNFGAGYWPKVRFGDNVETIYWLYNRTGDAWLLDLAKRIHDHMQDWTTGVHNWHNVNVSQGF